MATGESSSTAGKVRRLSPTKGCIFYLRNQKLSRKPQGARCEGLQYRLFDRLAGSCLGAVSQASTACVRRIYSVLRAARTLAGHAIRRRIYGGRWPADTGLAQRRKNRTVDLLRRFDAGIVSQFCARQAGRLAGQLNQRRLVWKNGGALAACASCAVAGDRNPAQLATRDQYRCYQSHQ